MLVPNTNTTATQMLLDNISKYHMNPSSIQQDILNVLELVLEGKDILDATSPFIYLNEASATCTAAAIAASEASTRPLYSRLSQTIKDLYRHISDKEYVGIFATGATSTITFLVPYTRLISSAIFLDPQSNVQTVVIPRDTVITVNGMDLLIGYPIKISIIAGNIIQVTYDTEIDNPLLPLTTNSLDSSVIVYNGEQYLQIHIPVFQASSFSQQFTLSSTNAFEYNIPFADEFYYARAFMATSTGPWVEILTTHSDRVYDINKPTVLLTVDNGNLNVIIPDIYQSLNLLGSSLRIDVYTTKGILEFDLSQVSSDAFSALWQDFDTLTINPAVAPLNSLSDIIIYSTEILLGGSSAKTFQQLYDRVVYHIDSTIAPIRESDVIVELSQLNYRVQKVIDSVTDRVYMASKNLPDRLVNGLSFSPLATNITIAIDTMLGEVSSGYNKSLLTHPIQRTTILPEALYLAEKGKITLLSDDQLLVLNSLTTDALINELNAKTYLYSPFHFIIDYTKVNVMARAYYLSKPSIIKMNAVDINAHKNFNIITTNMGVVLVDKQYILTITASIPTGLSGLIGQIRYYDTDNNSAVFLTGQTVINGNTATITFTFDTSLDIDQLNNIELTNFVNSSNQPASVFLNIVSEFTLFYLVPGNNTNLLTSFDNLYYVTPSMPAVIGAAYDKITIEFGKPLTNLYCPIRSLLTTGDFIKYDHDQYLTYNEDVYRSGPTGFLYNINPDNTISFIIQHHAGDFVLDGSGNQILLHKQGDYILDVHGQMIPDVYKGNKLMQHIGLTLFDARYHFATALLTKQYTDNIPLIVVGYLENELSTMINQLSERTELYYRPMGETNVIDVLIGEGKSVQVPGIIDIQITFFVTTEGLKNQDTLNRIEYLTRTLISKYFEQSTISEMDFISELKAVCPVQVTGFDVIKFLPNNLPILTIVDNNKRFVIGEQIVQLPDMSLDVIDTVKIEFILAP